MSMGSYTQRLTTLFIPLLTYVEQQLALGAEGDNSFKTEVMRRLEMAQTQALAVGYQAEDIQLALFAVVAWIDEMAMTSKWAGAMAWRLQPLQRQYFDTSKAGVEFYERLQSLDAKQTAVKEVYAAVLIAGYKGMYNGKSDQMTAPLIRTLLEELKSRRAISGWSTEEPLFATSPYQNQTYSNQLRRQRYQPTIRLLILIGVPLFVLMATFIYLDMSLGHMVVALTGRD